MNKEVFNELYHGFETAYINGAVASNVFYKPQFVSNNYREGKKVLSYIEDELLTCDHFQISVAFITMGGDIEGIGEERNSRRNSDYELFEF